MRVFLEFFSSETKSVRSDEADIQWRHLSHNPILIIQSLGSKGKGYFFAVYIRNEFTYSKRERQFMKTKIIIAVLFTFFLLSAVSCVRTDEKDKNDNIDTSSQIDETAENTDAGTIEFFKTDEDTLTIETPYVPLKYPARWMGMVKTETVQAEGAYGISFTAVLGGIDLPLYMFSFSDMYGGYKLGTVKTDSGEFEVYLTDMYDDAVDLLPKDEQLLYFQMCEDVNVIISKLVYDNGMVLAD